MINFDKLKKVPLREIWSSEATDFTPWLADNIESLGDALGLELELANTEASVGDFSLDILAKDLSSSNMVIIENQFSNTDHNHLGKLLTYAAGFDASTVVWVSEEVRKEHRDALEWLNQKTDTDTQFIAVVLEVRKIDDSQKLFRFEPVVFPNERHKSQRQESTPRPSPKEEKYNAYFQCLIEELKENRIFLATRSQSPNRRYFASDIEKNICFRAAFATKSRISVSVFFDGEEKTLFDTLVERNVETTSKFRENLEWERLDDKKRSTISVYSDGDIESSEGELEEIRQWHIQNLLKLKEVFTPEIERALETIDNGEL